MMETVRLMLMPRIAGVLREGVDVASSSIGGAGGDEVSMVRFRVGWDGESVPVVGRGVSRAASDGEGTLM